jgi:hypothetical protein
MVGRALDRFGVRVLTTCTTVLFGAVLAGCALVGSIWGLAAGFAGLRLCGQGAPQPARHAFWTVIAAVSCRGVLTTAVAFHQVSLLGEHGLSATEAAANFLPQTAAELATAILVGPLADRFPPRLLLGACLGVLVAGLLWTPLVAPELAVSRSGWCSARRGRDPDPRSLDRPGLFRHRPPRCAPRDRPCGHGRLHGLRPGPAGPWTRPRWLLHTPADVLRGGAGADRDPGGPRPAPALNAARARDMDVPTGDQR